MPAAGIASQRQRQPADENQHADTRQGKPQDVLALGIHFVPGIHRRRTHAAKTRQQPEQKRRANQRRDGPGRNFHPDARQPENNLVRKPEDQRPN
ncbi:hypothetical protein D3C78_1495690 [compost metagenome]